MVGFDDTHDVSSSQELGLNPNFDEINDAQMSSIGLTDQEKWCEKESGVVNAEMLNQLISAFSRLGKGKAAYEAFGKFEEFGCVLNVDSYYLTIEALCKRSFYDWATLVVQKCLMLECFQRVRRLVRSYHSYAKDTSPRRPMLSILLPRGIISILLRRQLIFDKLSIEGKNDIECAKKLFAEMMEKVRLLGMQSLILSLTLFPKLEIWKMPRGWYDGEARKVLSMAKRKHAKLCPATFHSLIRGYCNLGEFDRAVKLLSEMKDSGVEPNVDEYNKLIQSLCLKALDWKSAEKLLEEMKEKGLYLPGITRGLVSAVKELEQEAVGSEDDHAKP
uniref:Pentatricopeptide repeat-containing protein n=1 Tax=Chenopodium quinoa TaxID=63459 RepID=A0A803LAE8_CHEQI